MDELKIIEKIKYEKMILHIKYIALISLIITFGAVVLAGHSNTLFVSQFSFASTVTSIVLSVVAIWMTITSERQMNDVKDKIVNANDKLTNSTIYIEEINNNSLNLVEQQKDAYNKIKEEIYKLLNGLDKVHDEVSVTNNNVAALLLNNKKDDETTNLLTKDNLKEIIFISSKSRNQFTKKLIKIAINLCYDEKELNGEINLLEVLNEIINKKLKEDFTKFTLSDEDYENLESVILGMYLIYSQFDIPIIFKEVKELNEILNIEE